MLKKLLVWGSVLIVAALLAVPSFAQTTTDLNTEWGSDKWLVNQFGINGDISPFCQTIGQDPTERAKWLTQFPNLANVCNFSPATGDGGSGVSEPNSADQRPESGGIPSANDGSS
jgi:hypothetical protein